MSPSTIPAFSSGSGPDGIGDTTLFIATAASYTSDGPTLPIVGDTSAHMDQIQEIKTTNETRPSKKRKTKIGNATEPNEPSVAVQQVQVDLTSLYKPWTLLPPELLQQIEKRLSGSVESKTEVIVWSKNQNIKSGINRLKALLGFSEFDGNRPQRCDATEHKKADGLISISAFGEATTKMIGIVEMAKRVVHGGKAEESGFAEPWYTYTSLTGLTREQMSSDREGGLEREKRQTSKDDNKNKTPLLTVWISSKSIPELKTAFGEQTFTVRRLTDT